MSIAKLKLDESTKLEFGVSITGADSRPQARFVIEGRDFSLSYPCRPVGEGIEVEIGNLENIFESGEYPVRLEILIEDKMYVPFQDTLVLEPNVHVTTQPKQVEQVRESIKVDQVVVKAPEAKKKPARRSITEADRARQHKLANLIAKATGYEPVDGQTNQQIIEESLHNVKPGIAEEKADLIRNMIRKAQEAEIKFRIPKQFK
jgi:hypothetical protein